jgi:hypothetical protein
LGAPTCFGGSAMCTLGSGNKSQRSLPTHPKREVQIVKGGRWPFYPGVEPMTSEYVTPIRG